MNFYSQLRSFYWNLQCFFKQHRLSIVNRSFAYGLLGMALMLTFPAMKAMAAGLPIEYSGEKYSYSGTQAKVTLDGKSLSLKGTPGLIFDNTCMVSVKNVFAEGLGAAYTYDSESSGILVSLNDISIAMTLESKTAYVNGVKKTLDVAPRKVAFTDKGVTKIYVPARFVTENLGYTYTWKSTKKTAAIESPIVINYDGDWKPYIGIKGNVVIGGEKVAQSDIPGIVIEDTMLLRASLIFKTKLGCDYSYNSKTKKIVLAKGGVQISMAVGSKTALVNGKEEEMPAEPKVVTSQTTKKSYVMVPGEFVATRLKYEYIWNAATDSSVIIEPPALTYFSEDWEESLAGDGNIVTNVSAVLEDKIETISVTASKDYSYVVSESTDGKMLSIRIAGVYHDFQEIVRPIYQGLYLKSVTIVPDGDGMLVTLEKTEDCNYYTIKTGTTLKVILSEGESADPEEETYTVKINIPEGVSYQDINNIDQYASKKFTLTIPGNHLSYFDSHPITYDSSKIKKVAVTKSGDNTKITVTTNKIQGYKLTNCETYIGIDVDNPSKIFDRIVVLDAGHGGKDCGAVNSSKANEKDLNLKIIYHTAKKYFDAPNSKVKAYWTRTSDVFVTLANRAAFADKMDADVFVSLHMNSAMSSAAGLEVLYASNNKNKMSGMTSKTMAGLYKENLIDTLKMKDRGIKDRTRLVVLYSNTVPSILIELGFISNSGDYAKLKSSSFQTKTAKTIYDSTVEMFENYPTQR